MRGILNFNAPLSNELVWAHFGVTRRILRKSYFLRILCLREKRLKKMMLTLHLALLTNAPRLRLRLLFSS